MAARLSNTLRLVLDWAADKKLLAEVKPREMERRLAVIAALFPGLGRGTTNYDLGGGRSLKAELSLKADVAQDKLPAAAKALEATGELGAHLAGELIKWSGEIRIGVWKKLTPEQQALFAGVVTIVDGTPSLRLIEPEG